jgi:hypothetical protein
MDGISEGENLSPDPNDVFLSDTCNTYVIFKS